MNVYCGLHGHEVPLEKKYITKLLSSGNGPWHVFLGFICTKCMSITEVVYRTKEDPTEFIKSIGLYSVGNMSLKLND